MKSKQMAVALALLSAGGAHASWIKAGSAPFDLALETIVPQPYRIELKAKVSPSAVVAWSEGDNWMTVLRSALAPMGFRAEHDLARNTVVISGEVVPTTRPPQPTAVAQPASVQPVVVAQPTPVASATPAAPASWTLQAGLPINSQIEKWAEQAGWSFTWKPERTWVVPADASFGGTFDEALAKVVQALYDQGKGVKLMLWEGNKFAEVVDVNVR